jgi:AbrB family looped-hinge helix DNA binding protein
MTKVKMTENGTIVLPKALRDARGYKAGSEFDVIDGGRDIVLKPVDMPDADAPKKTLTVEEFLARRIPYHGPDITDEMINEAISKEAKRRWDEKNSR